MEPEASLSRQTPPVSSIIPVRAERASSSEKPKTRARKPATCPKAPERNRSLVRTVKKMTNPHIPRQEVKAEETDETRAFGIGSRSLAPPKTLEEGLQLSFPNVTTTPSEHTSCVPPFIKAEA